MKLAWVIRSSLRFAQAVAHNTTQLYVKRLRPASPMYLSWLVLLCLRIEVLLSLMFALDHGEIMLSGAFAFA